MTTPHGHPDSQSIVNTNSANLLGGPGTAYPVGHTLSPVIPCASWGSLSVNFFPTAGQGQVFIRHWTDAAGTKTAGNDSWPVNSLTNLNVRSPLRANYVQLDINVTSAGPLTANAIATLQSTTADKLSFPVGFQGVHDQSKTLAASTSVNYNPAFIAAGRAYLFFQPQDTSGKLSCIVYEADQAGVAFGILAKLVTTAPPVSQLLEVPDTALIVQVINSDAAAAHTFDLSLVIPPQ